MGRGFWIYLNGGVLFALPFMLGYIYMVIGLARGKKWAAQFFIVTVLLVLFLETLFIMLGGIRDRLVELFLILMVIVSSIGIIVLSISALVRKLLKK